MGRDVGFEDLKDVSPDVYSSLKKLLAYEGDVSELGLIFQVCSAPFYIICSVLRKCHVSVQYYMTLDYA